MFTFDKFALSNIFHHEFCSWNRNFVASYVDFIKGEGDKKVGLDCEEAKWRVWSILFREDYVKTNRRIDGSLDIVYLAYSLDAFQCCFDPIFFIYLHYRFYDTRGNFSERYFDF